MSQVKISTGKGDMIVELYDNETPITTNNFKKLIGEGFYNGLNFHRVLPNFVIQGGCPNEKQYHDKGVLSMAHAGRNTGGSQFFICHSRQGTQHLDRNHTCFGKVIDGLNVIDMIQQGDKINEISIL